MDSPEGNEEFSMKKRIVSDAIDAIYSNKNDEFQKKPIFYDDITFARPSKNYSFVQEKPTALNLKSAALYKTPEKRGNGNMDYYESTNISSRSASLSKLNYSRRERTFSEK